MGGKEFRIRDIKGLRIETTIDRKIPPCLPLSKGGITPLWERGARGDLVQDVGSILRLFISEVFLVVGLGIDIRFVLWFI